MWFASTWGAWFPSRILVPVWRLDRTHLASCDASRTAGQLLGRNLQPTIACAIKASTHVSISCSPAKVNEWLSSSRLAIRFGESHPTRGAPPGRGAHIRGVLFLECSGLTEPLTYRRSIAAHLVVSRPDDPSTPPRPLPPGCREALQAFPIRYAFRRQGISHRCEALCWDTLRSPGFAPTHDASSLAMPCAVSPALGFAR